MSWQSLADVFAYLHSDASLLLSSADAFVLVAIATYTRPDGTHAFPSLVTLRKLTRFSRSTLKRSLHVLQKQGLLERDIVRGRKGHSQYTLILPKRIGSTVNPITAGKGSTVNPRSCKPQREVEGKEAQKSRDPHFLRQTLDLSPGSVIWQAVMGGD